MLGNFWISWISAFMRSHSFRMLALTNTFMCAFDTFWNIHLVSRNSQYPRVQNDFFFNNLHFSSLFNNNTKILQQKMLSYSKFWINFENSKFTKKKKKMVSFLLFLKDSSRFKKFESWIRHVIVSPLSFNISNLVLIPRV